MILSPTFIPFLGVADDGAATHAGSLLLRAPAHVGGAFAFAVGHGVVARAGAARRDKAVLRRVGEGAIFVRFNHGHSMSVEKCYMWSPFFASDR